jgi:hypothetical protein
MEQDTSTLFKTLEHQVVTHSFKVQLPVKVGAGAEAAAISLAVRGFLPGSQGYRSSLIIVFSSSIRRPSICWVFYTEEHS